MLGTVLLLLSLVGIVSARWLALVSHAHTAYMLLCVVVIGYTLYRFILVPVLLLRSEDRLALLIEKRLPGLKDLLISSVQLARDMRNPRRSGLYSHELIGQLFEQTAEKLRDLRVDEIVERGGLRRNAVALVTVIGLFAIFTLISPAYMVQNFKLLFEPQYVPSGLVQPGEAVIGDITLTYRYPTYTGLRPRTIVGSSGDIKALKGSEVEITARGNQTITSAHIVVNESAKMPMVVESQSTIRGKLVVLESGSYRFETIPFGGKSPQKSKLHLITVEDDAYPEAEILAPISGKVVGERDVLRLVYRASDDFGVKEMRLVVGERPGTRGIRKTLRVLKEARKELRGTYRWELSELGLKPGERIPYYLEVVDNDAVSGPKVAKSETRYIEVYSTQKRHDELLSLQDKLLREMIHLLAEKLVNPPKATGTTDELLLQQEVLIERTVNLLVLLDKVLTRMEEDALANYAVYYSLQNMRDMLSQLNDNKERKLEGIERRGPILPVTIINEVQTMQEDEIAELENDIMFLVELLRKQRLDDFLAQDRRVEGMENILANLLNDLEKGETDELKNRITEELRKLEDMIRTMMEKLGKLSSNWGDEFLNLEALKGLAELTFNKDLQEMKDALARGDLEAALKAALNAVDALEKMMAEMGQSAQQYVDSTYSRTLQQMSNLDKRLRELEDGERKLAKKTEELKKNIESRNMEEMNRALNEFFQRQLNRLETMKDYLAQLEKSFEDNPDLKEYSRLEKETDRLLKKRDQAMRSPFMFGSPGAGGFSEEDFTELNEKVRQLNEARSKNPMLDTYEQISKALPNLEEKLLQLKEMLKGQDVKESLNLAKETLRDLRFWDYEVEVGPLGGFQRRGREEPSAEESQEMKEQAGEMLAGARGLNEEMVEDLASVRESFERRRKAGLTPEEKKLFEQLARRQRELEDHAKSLAQSLDKLARGNPSVGSEAGEELNEAQEFMGQAGDKLQDKDGPGALADERESLYRLSQARKKLGESMNRVAKGMMAGGIPMPKYVLRYRDMWSEGGRGFATGDVEIPSEDAYKVPKEFRQDILDAMKKGLPRKYHELNKDYYRKLVE